MTDIEGQSGEQIVRHLYKSLYSCADHLGEDLIKRIHISTSIEDAIIRYAKEKKVVFVTGNPGDGKTHVIRKISHEFPKGIPVVLDANVHADAALAEKIEQAYQEKTGIVIAINEGILLGLCQGVRAKCVWADEVIGIILKPYLYQGEDRPVDGIVIIDLNLRNNLSPAVVEQAIDRIAGMVAGESDSRLHPNARSLRHPVVKERLKALLDAVGRSGFHATMRDLLGFITFLLCGGEDEEAETTPEPYYVNAFTGGIGPLFDEVRGFDPIHMPSPFLDDQLYMMDDEEEDWEINPPDEYRNREDFELFKKRKRRAYFEHKKGSTILRAERDEVDRHFQKLRKVGQAPEYTAIQLLNHFFDASQGEDHLILWFHHQFWARQIRYVASRQTVSPAEFEILLPRLPDHLKHAFKDHYPDHVLLRHKSMGDVSDGLVMDRRFVKMLVEGDRQSGFGIRSLEAHSKIAAFYDRLARVCSNPQTVVRILRLDNQDSVRVGVNPEERAFYLPGVQR